MHPPPDLPVRCAELPIDLRGQWRDAQLGGLSQLLFARDEGLRGDVSVGFSVRGSIAMNAIATDIVLANARRADFIPPRPLSLEAACNAVARNAFHSFSSIECSWPPADSSNPSILIVAARLPDVDHPESSSGQITLPALPADTFFNWLSIAARHPPAGLAGSSGTLAGVVSWSAGPSSAGNRPTWSGELEFSGGSVAIGSPITIPSRSATSSSAPLRRPPRRRRTRTGNRLRLSIFRRTASICCPSHSISEEKYPQSLRATSTRPAIRST